MPLDEHRLHGVSNADPSPEDDPEVGVVACPSVDPVYRPLILDSGRKVTSPEAMPLDEME